MIWNRTVPQIEVSVICFQFNKDKYEDYEKKILKHITQYWNPMEKRLHESSTINLLKISTMLTPKAFKQSKLNILSVFHFVLFLFIKLFSLLYGTHSGHCNLRKLKLAVKSNLTAVFSPSVCLYLSRNIQRKSGFTHKLPLKNY